MLHKKEELQLDGWKYQELENNKEKIAKRKKRKKKKRKKREKKEKTTRNLFQR